MTSIPIELRATPRYRVLEGYATVNGMAITVGYEFETVGWPTGAGKFEPLNQGATRVLAFWRANGGNLDRPTPYDETLGRPYLPAPRGDTLRRQVLVLSKENVLPGMPAYRALTDINEVGAEPDLRRFWHRAANASCNVESSSAERLPSSFQQDTFTACYCDSFGEPCLVGLPGFSTAGAVISETVMADRSGPSEIVYSRHDASTCWKTS